MHKISKLKIILIFCNIGLVVLADTLIQKGIWDQGKDGGFTARLYCVSLMSMLFYFIIYDKYKYFYTVLGLIIGFFSTFLSYAIVYIVLDLNIQDIYFFILSVLIYISITFSNYFRTFIARKLEKKEGS